MNPEDYPLVIAKYQQMHADSVLREAVSSAQLTLSQARVAQLESEIATLRGELSSEEDIRID